MPSKNVRKPRPDDVARWVAALSKPIPDYYGGAALSEARRAQKHAREQLSSWGLDAQGRAVNGREILLTATARVREANAATRTPETTSTHPAPSTMAREAYAHLPTHLIEQRGGAEEARMHYAAGVAAERARVAADMRGRALRIRGRDPNEYAMIVVAYLETYADELEGKVQP